MNSELVSIIIPTFNRADSITTAVNSALNQTYSNVEVIIIDDGSIDNTKDVVERIHDERVRYIQLVQNAGASHARNVGIREANGVYISFHDSDDVMYPEKIQTQLDYLKKTGSEMVYCQVARFDLSGRSLGNLPIKTKTYNSIESTYEHFLMCGKVWTQTIFGTSRSIKSVLFDEKMKCRVDMDWSIRYAKRYPISYQKLPLVKSFIQKDSISQNKNNAVEATKIMYEKFKEDIEKKNRLKRAWQVEMIRITQMNRPAKDLLKAFFLSGDVRWLVRFARSCLKRR